MGINYISANTIIKKVVYNKKFVENLAEELKYYKLNNLTEQEEELRMKVENLKVIRGRKVG